MNMTRRSPCAAPDQDTITVTLSRAFHRTRDVILRGRSRCLGLVYIARATTPRRPPKLA